MHGLLYQVALAVSAAYVGALLLCILIDGVKALATRATANRMRARLARRRADLVGQRTPRAREGRASTALASAPAVTEAGVDPATRARLLGVDELLIEDSADRALFI